MDLIISKEKSLKMFPKNSFSNTGKKLGSMTENYARVSDVDTSSIVVTRR